MNGHATQDEKSVGKGFPRQPRLNKNYVSSENDPVLNEEWFVHVIKDKLANHPDKL
jgi:hypothetical protein